MSWSLVSGVMYLVLLGTIPAVGLLLVWRNTPPRSSAFAWAALAVPVFAFVFGGAWFAVPAWLSRGPDTPTTAMPIWFVFVLSGGFSLAFANPALLTVGVLLLVWRTVHPTSFARLTARVTEPESASTTEEQPDAS